ncbi:MAG: pilus assembly protein PilP [Porticoccaceae bacterium]|jgi:type IV pilus assembly protein PilP|nr:pilus assembly protein PilP [Porticoccaceae bacterium]
MATKRIYAGLLLLAVSLTSCSNDREFRDLQDFMAKVRAKPSGKIQPIPSFPPYEGFKYSAMAFRSPFDAPAAVVGERVAGNPAAPPDEGRPREVLENYNFAALSMVGVLHRDNRRWSLIDDGAGQIHRVTVGNYVGRNHGRIVQVTENRTDVIEIIPDGEGGWVERPRTLSLKEKTQ